MSQLTGTNSIVTGGGTGIGQAIAVALAGAGSRVVIAGRRAEALRAAVEQAGAGAPLVAHPVDVTDRTSVATLFDWVAGELGQVDILVCCAGVNISNRSMAEMQPEDWDRVLAINATGAFNCMHAALPQMRQRGGGLVLNVSSIAGKRALNLGGIAYCASKFAQTALGTAVGQEVAPEGVRVSNIYPGEVDTPILENRPTPVSDEHRAGMLQPADVAAAALMIATLPPRAHVPELVIKPTVQGYC
jgi:NADP-dependent 3-hydroxy acid dehydrogenase YdfG